MFFVLPVRDEPSPPARPWVNYGLIAANVLVFLIVSLPRMYAGVDLDDPDVRRYLAVIADYTGRSRADIARGTTAYSLFVFDYGFRPAAPSTVALFTSMFLHGGWMHLLGNMLFLWIFGDNVEHQLGRVRYVLSYVGMGVAATLVFALFDADAEVPMVGASGAISGVLGCYFLWFPRNRVKLLTVFVWLVNTVWVPARWVLGFYVLVENLLPFVLQSSSDGVAYGAHLGGFVAGLGVAAAFERFGGAGARAAAAPRPGAVVESPLVAFRRSVAAESWEHAVREYSVMSTPERGALAAHEVFGLADWLSEAASYDAAVAVLRRWVGQNPTHPGLAAAHLRLGLIQLHGLGRPTSAYQHLLTVLDLEPAWDIERAARRALEEIAGSGGRPTLH